MSKAKKKTSYTKEFKASVLRRLEEPSNTIASVSDELGVPRTTVYQWVKKSKTNSGNKNSINNKPSNKWTSEDKFQVVLETSTLSEIELAEYCRRKGIYVDEVTTWRAQCLKANQSVVEDPKELKESLRAEKELNKRLERELIRKEKALAETAALLVLRKKANAIWGDPEEE